MVCEVSFSVSSAFLAFWLHRCRLSARRLIAWSIRSLASVLSVTTRSWPDRVALDFRVDVALLLSCSASHTSMSSAISAGVEDEDATVGSSFMAINSSGVCRLPSVAESVLTLIHLPVNVMIVASAAAIPTHMAGLMLRRR